MEVRGEQLVSGGVGGAGNRNRPTTSTNIADQPTAVRHSNIVENQNEQINPNFDEADATNIPCMPYLLSSMKIVNSNATYPLHPKQLISKEASCHHNLRTRPMESIQRVQHHQWPTIHHLHHPHPPSIHHLK